MTFDLQGAPPFGLIRKYAVPDTRAKLMMKALAEGPGWLAVQESLVCEDPGARAVDVYDLTLANRSILPVG